MRRCREKSLFGISDASQEKMSALHNPLIMGGKLTRLYVPLSQRECFHVEIWGKSHMELRVDTQFVRFREKESLRPLTLNKIQADEKELKMLTKRQVWKYSLLSRRL